MQSFMYQKQPENMNVQRVSIHFSWSVNLAKGNKALQCERLLAGHSVEKYRYRHTGHARSSGGGSKRWKV